MDLHEQRMQCLKMAFDLGGKPEAVLSAAQQLLDFVSGPLPTIEETAVADEPVTDAPVAAEPVPDPIAACGTALVMQEGGELADAVATGDALPLVAEPEEAALAEPASSVSETAVSTESVEEISTEFSWRRGTSRSIRQRVRRRSGRATRYTVQRAAERSRCRANSRNFRGKQRASSFDQLASRTPMGPARRPGPATPGDHVRTLQRPLKSNAVQRVAKRTGARVASQQ